jgi:hypothetical protein
MNPIEAYRREMELRLSVSPHRLSKDGLAGIFMSDEEIDAENQRYDDVLRQIHAMRQVNQRWVQESSKPRKISR